MCESAMNSMGYLLRVVNSRTNSAPAAAITDNGSSQDAAFDALLSAASVSATANRVSFKSESAPEPCARQTEPAAKMPRTAARIKVATRVLPLYIPH